MLHYSLLYIVAGALFLSMLRELLQQRSHRQNLIQQAGRSVANCVRSSGHREITLFMIQPALNPLPLEKTEMDDIQLHSLGQAQSWPTDPQLPENRYQCGCQRTEFVTAHGPCEVCEISSRC